MADNKKYYYMRLKENFFETDEMIYLESLEEGYLFSNILLKLYLRSLKNEGILMMNEFVPYDARLISKFTGHSLSTVEKALFEFKKLGLIELLDSGQMYMSHIELFVGKTTTEADRKRLGRMKAEQKLLEPKKELGQMSDKCPPEIEIEIEIEKDKTYVQQVELFEAKGEIDLTEIHFKKFWDVYNKKQDIAKARKSFAKVIKKHDINTIIEHTLKYLDFLQAKYGNFKYQKMASTFLNNFDLEDDFTVNKKVNEIKQGITNWEEMI